MSCVVRAMRIARRLLAMLLLLALAAGWFFVFRPAGLGGPASYMIISGSSMEPGLSAGDLVVLQKRDTYRAGETIAYPASGGIVIHRVIGADPAGYVTQGDNRDTPDFWRPTSEQVLGSQWLHVPYVGHAIMHLTPAIMAALSGSVAALSVLLRRDAPRKPRRQRRRGMLRRLVMG